MNDAYKQEKHSGLKHKKGYRKENLKNKNGQNKKESTQQI